jgi:hypothetical protein
LHTRPQSWGAQIAAACGLSFQSGIGSVLDLLRQEHLVEIRGQRGIGDAGYAYALTSKGAARAAEALERTRYQGPLPVSLADYVASVEAQPIDRRLVTRERMREAFTVKRPWPNGSPGSSAPRCPAWIIAGCASNAHWWWPAVS